MILVTPLVVEGAHSVMCFQQPLLLLTSASFQRRDGRLSHRVCSHTHKHYSGDPGRDLSNANMYLDICHVDS